MAQLTSKKQLQKIILCFVKIYLSPQLVQGQACNWSYLTVHWRPWAGLGQQGHPWHLAMHQLCAWPVTLWATLKNTG